MKPGDDLRAFYDARYTQGYQVRLSGYEIARYKALRHCIGRAARLTGARKILDYGCGSGLYTPLWLELFPRAELWGCDLSRVALDQLGAKHPDLAPRLAEVRDNRADLAEGGFDLCLSVEVMEHVADLSAYLRDINRLLRPGGVFLWTTPCANRLSVEHLYALCTRAIEPTAEGYRRWAWEDKGHLRRLRSGEIAGLLGGYGFRDIRFRFRAHLFSFVCDRLRRLHPRLTRLDPAMSLDYLLFRRLPNAASMIGWARKV